MVSLVVCFLHMVGGRQQTHLQHHLQKSQLSLPESWILCISVNSIWPLALSYHLASHYGGHITRYVS